MNEQNEQIRFLVNGLPIQAQFRQRDKNQIFIPLLQSLTALQRQRKRRIVAFLAAPPAAGKSTLCLYLEKLSRELPELLPIQSVGIDGFHYANAYLRSHFIERNGESLPLSRIKGAPETYDVDKLAACLADPDAKWPIYDRRIHDPVENALEIQESILLVEGNWLLLDEAPWNRLSCDYSIFWAADSPAQLERVVQRKIMGGFAEAEAREFVMQNDLPNIRRCMEVSRRGDLNIRCDQNGFMEVE